MNKLLYLGMIDKIRRLIETCREDNQALALELLKGKPEAVPELVESGHVKMGTFCKMDGSGFHEKPIIGSDYCPKTKRLNEFLEKYSTDSLSRIVNRGWWSE